MLDTLPVELFAATCSFLEVPDLMRLGQTNKSCQSQTQTFIEKRWELCFRESFPVSYHLMLANITIYGNDWKKLYQSHYLQRRKIIQGEPKINDYPSKGKFLTGEFNARLFPLDYQNATSTYQYPTSTFTSSPAKLNVWKYPIKKAMDYLQLKLSPTFTSRECCCLHVTDRHVVAGLSNGEMQLFNFNGRQESSLREHRQSIAALESLSQIIYSASFDRTIKAWNPILPASLYTLRGHHAPVTCLKIIDAYSLASGSEDHSIIVWDLVNRTVKATWDEHKKPIHSLRRLADLFLSADTGGKIYIRHIKSHEIIRVIEHQGERSNTYLTGLYWDLNKLVTATFNGSLHFWDTNQGTYLRRIESNQPGYYQVTYQEDTFIRWSHFQITFIHLQDPKPNDPPHPKAIKTLSKLFKKLTCHFSK